MSYRTYILEKELSEVKAMLKEVSDKYIALLKEKISYNEELAEVKADLEATIETFASVVHRLDDNFDVENCCLLSPDVVEMFNAYFGEANYYAKLKAEEHDRWCQWDEGQMSDEEYYHGPK